MNQKVSNDTIILTPRLPEKRKKMEFNFPSVKIGIAEYEEGPTGCTVFYFPNEAVGAVDIRGGSPSTFTTDNHNLAAGERILDAICFTGGSVHGLEAVTGVTATVGKGFNQWEEAGQGAAFRQIGQTKIAVFTVVNSLGGIMNRNGEYIRGYFDKHKNARYLDVEQMIADKNIGNTTLTLVVTNQKLPAGSIRQLSKQIHTSMARAIYPFHTLFDGDVLFMVSTSEVENQNLDTNTFGLIASEIAWDAVLNCVHDAN